MIAVELETLLYRWLFDLSTGNEHVGLSSRPKLPNPAFD